MKFVSRDVEAQYGVLYMKLEDRDDFVDLVAQAVIDKIEERDRITGLVEMVVSRVLAMQKAEAELKAAVVAELSGSENVVKPTTQ